MIVLNREIVTNALKAAVAERGEDYIYTEHFSGCVYVRNALPACIVGQVLADLGVSVETLARFDNNGGATANQVLYALERGGTLTYDQATSNALEAAQYHQDKGRAWGHALREAERAYEAYRQPQHSNDF